MKTTPLLLAAGQGTRMKSDTPKVLHELFGKPLIQYALQAAQQASRTAPVLVVGYDAERIRSELGDQVQYVYQEQLLGTGHAVQQAEEILRDQTDQILVTYGDMPLVREQTLRKLIETQTSHSGPLTMLSLRVDNPRGFGRVIRNTDGAVQAIVEEADATPEQLEVRELNAGMYCIEEDWLWDALRKIELSPKGEYYLTDLVQIAVQEGHQVAVVQIADQEELIGINTRLDLADAYQVLQRRINAGWMEDGVTILDPRTVHIDPEVQIGRDTVLLPGTHLTGRTVIGENCQIGPATQIDSSTIGDHCQIRFSVVEEAVLENQVDVGPFGHLRRGAHLAEGVHMGNFGEVKNSYLGPGTKMGHFSYLGDATLGQGVNVGAGTITCNYDGKRKHATIVEDGVFIGSDTMLVAPVKIGKGARTGAGAVVTRDVDENTLAVGMPARSIRKVEE
jgi:bifunctional UDP-N-acetylglucosamine pyrophosphorylase/glucosamine-1-phosphate N-acetyltransferase